MSRPPAQIRARRRVGLLVGALVLLAVLLAGGLAVIGLLAPIRASEERAQLPTADDVTFHLPHGNTACRLNEDGARCDIRERTWAVPAPPTECPDAWGNTVEITGDDPAPQLVCLTEPLLGEGFELPYGQRLTRGDFECSSRESAVRCVNTVTQHGFSVSENDYTPF